MIEYAVYYSESGMWFSGITVLILVGIISSVVIFLWQIPKKGDQQESGISDQTECRLCGQSLPANSLHGGAQVNQDIDATNPDQTPAIRR